MDTSAPSYTVADLKKETGFDRRTIAYYVQEGLLPRVGRRGPGTRYPKLVRDRLLFIRRLRDAADEGKMPALLLSDFRQFFKQVSPALVARVADRQLAVTDDSVLPALTALRHSGKRRAALHERVDRMGLERKNPRAGPKELAREFANPMDYSMPAPQASPRREADHAELLHAMSPVDEVDLVTLLLRLQEVAILRRQDPTRSMKTWTRINISPEIVLSVSYLTEEDRQLVARVRRAMRRAVSDETTIPPRR